MMDYIVDTGMQATTSSTGIPLQYKKYQLPFEYTKTTSGPFGCVLIQILKGEGWLVQQTDFFIEQKVRLHLCSAQPLAALYCMLEGRLSVMLHSYGSIVPNTNEVVFLYLPSTGTSWMDLAKGHSQSVHIEFTTGFLHHFTAQDVHLKKIYDKLKQGAPEGDQVSPCEIPPMGLEQIEKIRKCHLQGVTRQLYSQARIHDLLCFYFEALKEVGQHDTACKERAVRELAIYISDNLSEPVTISDLARLAGMSYFTLPKAFKKVFHQTPVEYIRQQRIERAAKLMRETQYTITNIAQSVGFIDVAYFSRVFRQYFGCAPSVYREEKRYVNAG